MPLPTATFSYFDPLAKRYVTVPIYLPSIAVTGAMPIPAAGPMPANGVEAAATVPRPKTSCRIDPTWARRKGACSPVYREPWFWVVQGGLALLPLLGLAVYFVRRRAMSGQESVETVSRRRSLRQEEVAMAEAVRQNDTHAFFVAARHAVQLQLGAQWAMPPKAITLGEIRRRDPALGERLEPLFRQADEVIYSGRAGTNIDLAKWDGIVREMLQLQPA